VGPWFDPIPTPGKPNILESENENNPVENPEHDPVKVDDDDENDKNKETSDVENPERDEFTIDEDQNEASREEAETVNENIPPEENIGEVLSDPAIDEIENNETMESVESSNESFSEESLGEPEKDGSEVNSENNVAPLDDLQVESPENNNGETPTSAEPAEDET
jgi:hypothetical protein